MAGSSSISVALPRRWRDYLEYPGVNEALIALLTLLVYARSLTLGFVYDDHVIFRKPWILSWSDLAKLFTEDVIVDHASNFYRPLAVLWHSLMFWMAGTNSVVWHLSSVLLHILCVVLAYRVIWKLLQHRLVAAFAALVFALHPTHVEAVSWISDAADPLMTALLLLSALALMEWMKGGRPHWWIASWLLFVACCFVKESAILMPPLLLVLAFCAENRRSQPEFLLTGAALFASAGGFLILRSHVLGGIATPLSNASNVEMLLTIPAALWFYITKLLLPVELSPVYPLDFVSDGRSAAFLSPLLLLVAIAAALSWLCFRLRGRGIFWFCAVWMLVPLVAPLYLKLFPRYELVHDRYLYVPSIALGVVLAAAVKEIHARLPDRLGAELLAIAALGLVIALAVATISYQAVWKSDLTLFQRAIELTPHNARALVNLAVAKLEQGNYPEGTALLQRALEIEPNNAFALADLGNVALRKGDAGTAEMYFQKALALETRFQWWVLLADARFKLGKLTEAESAVRRALALDPKGLGAHSLLGGLRLAQGDALTAIREFNIELQLNPDDKTAQDLLQLAQKQLASKRY